MKALFFALLLLGLLSLPTRAQENVPPDFSHDAVAVLRGQPHLVQYVRQNFQVRSPGIARVPGHDGIPPQPPFIFKARPRGTNSGYYITLLIQPGPPGHILKVVDPTRPNGRPPGVAGPSYLPPSQSPYTGGEPQAPAEAQPPAEAQAPEPGPGPASAPYTGGEQPFSPSGNSASAPTSSPITPSEQAPAEAPAQQPAPQPSEPSANTPSGPTSDTPSGPVGSSGQGATTLPPAPTNSTPSLSPPPDPAPANQ